MNQVSQTSETTSVQPLQLLPNSTASLVLGILSIVFFCCCFGIFGVTLGIIGLVLGLKAVALYKQSPGVYTEASYKNANAGKICSIIGLTLTVVYILYFCYLIFFMGAWSTYMTMFNSILDGTYNF